MNLKLNSMKNVKLEQVGELLQAIYDTETNFKIDWSWDGGFDFSFEQYYNEHPLEVKELHKTIDSTNLEQVASLILIEYQLRYSIVDTNGEINSIGKFIKSLEG
jgi:hypothetical protein